MASIDVVNCQHNVYPESIKMSIIGRKLDISMISKLWSIIDSSLHLNTSYLNEAA